MHGMAEVGKNWRPSGPTPALKGIPEHVAQDCIQVSFE